MNGTVEIDKAGRLVVPKKLRDNLSLSPGTRLTIRQQGSTLVMEREKKHYTMSLKDGMPVFIFDHPLPSDHVDWVNQSREDRIDYIIDSSSE